MKRGALIVGLVVTLLVILPVAAVEAEGPVPELVLELPDGPSVGDTVTFKALLLDTDGDPISGEVITFSADAEFLNTFEKMELGTATTDEDGLASLELMMRTDGEQTITARFAGSKRFAGAKATDSFQVAPGPQIFDEEPPYRVPGANIVLVALVLAFVWSIYLGAMGMLYLVSRSGARKIRVVGGADE